MTQTAKEIRVIRITKSKTTCRHVLTRLRTPSRNRISVGNSLRSTSAAYSTRPVDSVGLNRVGAHFHQARFNHDLLGRLIDRQQYLADVVDVAAGLTEEHRIGSLIDLRRTFAGEL